MKDEGKNDSQERARGKEREREEWKRASKREATRELERREGINERGDICKETRQKRR